MVSNTTSSSMNGSLRRLAAYFGREDEKLLLHRLAEQVVSNERSVALYFQADGGLGKTRLLELLPQILQEAPEPQRTQFERLLVAQTIDFYSFESRDPNVIEQLLIKGLKQTAAAEWYRLPETIVDEYFKAHAAALQEYRQAREQFNETQLEASIAKLRQSFIDCWNRLAAEHPMVICFDTIETLFVPPAPEGALASASNNTAGLDVVAAWMRNSLPQLKHTLLVLSGRPVDNNRLITDLSALNLTVQQLKPFENADDIRAYLHAYECDPAPHSIEYIQTITEGRPLLLTCYAELRRPSSAKPPGLPGPPPSPEVCTNREEFQDWLIEHLLDPMLPPVPIELSQSTLALSLYFLVYARRGVTYDELVGLFEEVGFKYERQAIEQLGDVALVKHSGDRLFLHDEIFVMIDESRKPNSYGMQQPTLDYLCDITRKRVHAASDRSELIGAMADNMYYELTRDFNTGYRVYTVYTDWLLIDRGVYPALALSDAFWRTLNYAIKRPEETVYPYRDALKQSSVSEQEIARDERVNAVQFLLARDQNSAAMALATELAAEYVQQGLLLPDDDEVKASALLKDQFLFADLSLWRAYAIHLAEPASKNDRAEQLFTRIITFLEQPEQINDEFLRHRRLYFLGHAYNWRGYLRRTLQSYKESQEDYEHARAAFRSYRTDTVMYRGQQMKLEELYNDRIVSQLAPTTNNLAYVLSLTGNLKRAQRLSDEVIRDYATSASDYRQALYYNTNALIHLNRGEFLEAQAPLERASEAAERSGSIRAKGLVAQARALLGSAMMNARQTPDTDVELPFKEAADLLKNEPDALRTVYYDWAGYARVIGLLYAKSGQAEQAQRYRQQALDLFDETLKLLPEASTLRRSDLIESQATVYIDMGEYSQAAALLEQAEAVLQQSASEYGQVVAGKIALQRAILALRQHKDYQGALRLMLVALAHAYVFARLHLDQGNIERAIDQLVLDIPDQQLRDFRQALTDRQINVAVSGLAYPQPNEARWNEAWQNATSFLIESITPHLDILL